MANGKKSFKLYTDIIELVNGSNKHDVEIEPMTDEEAGQLFRWIIEYVNDLHPVVPKNIKYAVVQIKKQLDSDLDSYKEICRKNKENIEKRWNTKNNQSIPNDTSVYERIPNDTKNTDKDKEKDKDIISKKNVVEKATAFIPPTLEEIKQYCDERNNLVDPERFYNFYSAKGWMVGKNKMKDWKAAVRTWESEAGFKNDKPHFGGFQMLGESDEDYEKRTGIKRYKPNKRN